ncbi:hypothetical protein CAC42_5326 [Sphaceloma murrayae]|uniref:DNA-directed RNA polymerase III subunit rpc5 n=1 Tax=Sphaceloma murrayae TaxID=2082308 RepID=A0A2K1QUP8_9PEZI|nr:hypothetical protein CAC42_5326 [Sphaceloma murrayae]
MLAIARKDEGEDPVVSEYDIFITPAVTERVYVLQYPLRNIKKPYNSRNGATPLEMRIKPDAGFVEVDVAMDPAVNFDKAKGVEWSQAMLKAKGSGLTTFGASAGFGPGNIKADGRRARGEDLNMDIDHYGGDRAFHRQTLGGQILSPEEGEPQYMLGTFRGKELHLTKVDGIAQVRPQFHHMDAQVHVEKAGSQREPDDSRPAQARGFTQTYKQAREDTASTAKSMMQIAQEEKWTRLNFFDEDDPESYAAYGAKMFNPNVDEAEQLFSSMSNEDYLNAVGAPRHDPSSRRKKKQPLTKKERETTEVVDGATAPAIKTPS